MERMLNPSSSVVGTFICNVAHVNFSPGPSLQFDVWNETCDAIQGSSSRNASSLVIPEVEGETLFC